MEHVYQSGTPPVYLGRLAMLVGGIVLIISIWAVFSPKARRAYLWRLLFFWTFAPPAWFVLDYFVLYKTWGVDKTFEAFQYGQEVAAKFWAGGLALVAAKLFQDKESTSIVQEQVPPRS